MTCHPSSANEGSGFELYFAKFVECFEIDKAILKKALEEFYNDVDIINDETVVDNEYISDVKSYKESISQGTNHRSSRITRGKILAKIIANSKI